MRLEDVGQLVRWLALLMMSLNLAVLFFLLCRRLIRTRYFREKDAARKRYRDAVDAVALGQLGLKQAATSLEGAKTSAEREAVSAMLFAALNADNSERISELLFLLGFVEQWANIAFRRRAAKELASIFLGKEGKTAKSRWPKLLRPLYRMRLTAVSRALAVNNLGSLSPRHAHVFLMAALSDPSSEVRRVAIERLGHNGDPKAIPSLLEELRKSVEEHNDLSLRSLKASLICYRLKDLELFLPYLTNPNRRCRFFVIDSIRQIAEREAVNSPLTKNDFSPALYRVVLEHCQFDEFADVRARTPYIARFFRDQNAIKLLRRLMQDKNEFVRMHTLRACDHRFYLELIPDILTRLTDERWQVREAAVQALRAMGSEGRDAMLHFFVECTDRFAAEQACDEFQRRGIVPELAAAIAAGGERGRLAEKVARKMAATGKTSLLLSQLTSSHSFAVRVALMDTLAIHPSEEFVSLLSVMSREDSGQLGSKARELLSRIHSGSSIRFAGGRVQPADGKAGV